MKIINYFSPSSAQGLKMSGSSRSPIPTTIITAGLDVIEHHFIWRIRDFPVIASQDSLIELQHFDFEVVDGRGQLSKWNVHLVVDEVEGVGGGEEVTKWIGIFYTTDEGSLPANAENWFSEVLFQVKDKDGNTTWSSGLNPNDLQKVTDLEDGWGENDMIKVSNDLPETLEIHISFKLHSPTAQPRPTPRVTVEAPLGEELQLSLAAKARKDLAALVKNPVVGDVKMVSGDEMEFVMPRGILSARSPVFQAMFRTDMTEATVGLLQLPDITGKSLEVLLHFFYTGELLPQWKHGGIIIELTNAAAKYQLSELLQFLDMMLGKVCGLENVVQLFILAGQLSLKTAEKELLKFIREKGVSSPENFVQIVKAMNGSE